MSSCRIHTSEKSVQLDQELEVDIVTLGSLTMAVLDVVAVEIDTHLDLSECVGLERKGDKQVDDRKTADQE
jgi:hypothetical protein